MTEMKLTVDGNEIQVNEFVQEIISNTVAGAVRSLNGVEEDWKEIELNISR